MEGTRLSAAIAAALFVFTASAVQASSHREAPAITELPKVDNTDVYAFNSYESGRDGFVTLIANYIPFQDPWGGPNYYALDEDAVYTIHVDNDGDAVADIEFVFDAFKTFKDTTVEVGGESVAIPLINSGPIGPGAMDTTALNRIESYDLEVRRNGQARGELVTNPDAPEGGDDDGEDGGAGDDGEAMGAFLKPVDYIGNKSIPEYANYASAHIYDIGIPGCGDVGGHVSVENARVFVGQRKESFVVNIGELFDLINLNPLGDSGGEDDGDGDGDSANGGDNGNNPLDEKNVTTFALELPASCLTSEGEPVVGVWATASKSSVLVRARAERDIQVGRMEQVSRLGNPLVNEVVIGLPDKDRYNGSPPADDAQFLTYVTHPTLPKLIEILFPDVQAPNVFPREDLVNVFLLGVEGLNRPANGVPAEMMRLNTSIPAVPATEQNPLGVLAGDNAGYPNGRRPGDDVVDISLRVLMGALLSEDVAPAGQLPFTDGADIDATMFADTFPYLNTPIPGAPNELREGEDDDEDDDENDGGDDGGDDDGDDDGDGG